MKKGWKIFWLTCGITLVVGIALLGIGLGMGATMEIVKERAPIKETYSPNIQESYQGIRELDLDIAAGEIKILKAPKEQQEITVETQKISKSLKFKCYEILQQIKKSGTGFTREIMHKMQKYIFIFQKDISWKK